MTHASLCKRTYKMALRFHPTKSRRMDKMRSQGSAVFLFLASAALVPAQGAFNITTVTLPAATVGVAYSAQLTETGAAGSVTWTVFVNSDAPSGTLPAGLSLDATSGIISGTPSEAGVSSFTIEAEDSAQNIATKSLSINVGACTPTLTPAPPLPGSDVNVKYGPITFAAVGCPDSGPFTFFVDPSTLPPGLVLQNTILSGTPRQVGSYPFYLTASGPNQTYVTVAYSITVNPPPTITTPSPLPGGPVGVPYFLQITATGGTPPYKFSMNNNPPGIGINASGILSGTPTQAGTFGTASNPITIEVQDSLFVYSESPFTVTFGSGTSLLQVSPLSLTFNAVFEGNPPLTQAISVVPGSGATPPANFNVLIDGGASNPAVPSWISVSPTSGAAPAGLVVNVNQAGLAAGPYSARIRVLDSNSLPTDVSVLLNVSSPAQQLTVSPSLLRFGARAAAPGVLVEDLLVSNAGAGTLAFNASVVGGSSWIAGISPSSGQATLNTPVFLQVQVNTSGLQVGSYHDTIQLASSTGNIDIPISVFVAAGGPLLAVNTTGVLFQSRQSASSSVTNNIEILNIGDPNSTVNWTASLVAGSNWLSLASPSGTATPAAPGVLSLSLAPNARQLTAGPYYALIKIADSNSLNSPQFVIAVLNLEPDSTAPSPYVSPAGVFLTAPPTLTGAAPTAQVLVNTSSLSPVPFQAATTTSQGSWLSATPSSGNADGQTPGQITISANPTGLNPGIYTGNVSVSISQVLQSVNVTFVVSPAAASNASSRPRPEASSCTPSTLAITETGLANNFAVPAGWPATLIVQLNDDCGSLVPNGNVVANFSNGDAPLALVGDSLGNYSATWQPGAVNSEMVVTLNATAGALQPATAKLYGGIAQNQTPPPTLAPGGTVSDFNPLSGAAVAPGIIAQVYGSGLAVSPVSTGILPLPALFNNTFAQAGDYQAPLYFLSNDQLNVQIPAELVASQQLPMLISVNNALTLPITLDIVPAAPGVLSAFDGPTPPSVQNGAHIAAQHLNGSSVTSASPGNPGEYLVMYLAGLGATKPSVPSGMPAPGPPATLATVVLTPTVTVDNLPSKILFAGLTPTFVGLYQIDFQVPTGAHSGEDVVTVTQNGIAANPTLLPVSP
jgi:uncharacterized protein (TIGR03437 family)